MDGREVRADGEELRQLFARLVPERAGQPLHPEQPLFKGERTEHAGDVTDAATSGMKLEPSGATVVMKPIGSLSPILDGWEALERS